MEPLPRRLPFTHTPQRLFEPGATGRVVRATILVFALPLLVPVPPASAWWPYLVSDINRVTADSHPRFLGRTDDGWVFAADDGVHGTEVWVHTEVVYRNGLPLPGTTRMLRDIRSGPEGSSPYPFAELDGIVYFLAEDDVHGREIWRTDGTPTGTTLVTDIGPGLDGRVSGYLETIAGVMLFAASDGVHGHEPWRTDGTAAGTWMVADIKPGGSSSPDTALTALGRVFFTADDGTHGRELWQFDPAGETVGLVLDLKPGERGSYPENLTRSGNRLFLTTTALSSSEATLWTTDGTPAGTVPVSEYEASGLYSYDGLVDADGTLYFTALHRDLGRELWRSDGTAAGTELVQDLYPGRQGSQPSFLLPLGGELLFEAIDPTWGRQVRSTASGDDSLRLKRFEYAFSRGPLYRLGDEVLFWITDPVAWSLWKTDGTEARSQLVRPATYSGPWRGCQPARIGDNLYFVAYAGEMEMWRTDGTHAGTGMVTEIGPEFGRPAALTDRLEVLGDTLLFVADDGRRGAELWRTDGTAEGTRLTADINQISADSDPQPLALFEGLLYFDAKSAHRARLWTTDGTSASEANPTRGERTREALALGSELLLAGSELYKSDGQTLQALRDPAGGSARDPRALTPLNGPVLFFASQGQYGAELWRTDGSRTGTSMVLDIRPGSVGSIPREPEMVVAAGLAYFVADDGAHGPELWRSDGTAAGTSLVRDIHPSSGSSYGLYRGPTELEVLGDTLYFVANDGLHGSELWRSDGSAGGTVMVEDITPGPYGSRPRELTVVGETLFFAASSEGVGGSLWKTNPPGADATFVRNIQSDEPQTGDFIYWPFLADFTALDGLLYFTGYERTHGRELWRSDGTEEGTRVAVDIYPGPGSSRPTDLRAIDGTLFFSAVGPGDQGREPWRTDGTPEGAWQVADIRPGEGGSDPESFTKLGGRVLFSANDGYHGRELWAVSALGTACLVNELLTLESRSVSTDEDHQTCGAIRVGPALSVETGASLGLTAGSRIELIDGVRINAGASLRAETAEPPER